MEIIRDLRQGAIDVQVGINLLMNAAQAMPEGGTITFQTRCIENTAVFSVADTGPGVPDETVDKIFDPFFTTKPTGVGTGLGLSICYRIVEKLGGRITYAHRPGGGALFTVTLPVATHENPAARPPGGLHDTPHPGH